MKRYGGVWFGIQVIGLRIIVQVIELLRLLVLANYLVISQKTKHKNKKKQKIVTLQYV